MGRSILGWTTESYGTWLKGTTNLRGYDDEPVAATGAWTAEDTFEARFCYYDSFFCPVFRFRYTGGELRMDVEPNVSWGLPTETVITGEIA